MTVDEAIEMLDVDTLDEIYYALPDGHGYNSVIREAIVTLIDFVEEEIYL